MGEFLSEYKKAFSVFNPNGGYGAQQTCNGTLKNCFRATEITIQTYPDVFCLADSNSDRRYHQVTHTNLKNSLGNYKYGEWNDRCNRSENLMEARGEAGWNPCDICACYCHEPDSPKSHRNSIYPPILQI